MAADVTVAAGAIGTNKITLVASTVYEVDFSEDLSAVEVIPTVFPVPADIWWTNDGTTPSAGVGFLIPAGVSATDRRQVPTGSATIVKLFTAGTGVGVRVNRGDMG